MTPEEFDQLITLLSKFFQEKQGAIEAPCYCIAPTCNNTKCAIWWSFYLLSDKPDDLKNTKWV